MGKQSAIASTESLDSSRKESEYVSQQQAEQSSIMAYIAEANVSIHTNHTYGKEPIREYILYRFNPLRSHQVSFLEYNAKYKIEFIRQISDSRVYCVQKALDGYFLTFWEGENIREGGWLYNSAFIQKTLDRQAFISVKEGTNCAIVKKIDPAISVWLDVAQQDNLLSFQSTLILKDGLLVIDFAKKQNEYIVQKVSFYDDFKLKESSSVVFDCSILQQDYPQ
jgi:hypothetical protein